MAVFSSYTLYYLCECQQYPVGSNHLGNPVTDSDVDDGHRGHHSPAEIFYVDDRRRSRDRAEIFDDPGRRDDVNAGEANSSPPLT